MTRDIFCKIMHQIETKNRSANRKQLILLDNYSAHTSFENTYDGEKTFTKVLFLPKNCTSKIQPCDQGVIRSIKAHYRGPLNRVLLATEVNGVSLYMALCMVRAAWTIDVKEDVIRNAWVHTGLLAGPVEETQIGANVDDDGRLLQEDANLAEIEDNEAIVMEYLEVDNDRILDEQMQETEENDDDTESPIPPPSTAQCFTMLQSVKARFMASTGEIPDSLLQVEDKLMRLPHSKPYN